MHSIGWMASAISRSCGSPCHHRQCKQSYCAHGAQDKIPREIAARRQMNIHYPLQNEAEVWSGVWPILADGVGLTDAGREGSPPSFPTRNAAPNCGEEERERPFFMAIRPERMDGRKGSKREEPPSPGSSIGWKNEKGTTKGGNRERLFDTEDKLRLQPSVGCKDEKLTFTALTRMTRPCSHINYCIISFELVKVAKYIGHYVRFVCPFDFWRPHGRHHPRRGSWRQKCSTRDRVTAVCPCPISEKV